MRLNKKTLEKMRQDFVANVSHELRTPLTVLRGYLEGLIDTSESKNATDVDWRPVFDQMHQQTIRMENILEDLLHLSRLEIENSIFSENESIHMPELLNVIREDALALSHHHTHQIFVEINAPDIFHGQKLELRSAFSNLVFNAVHYTPSNGRIYIRWYQNETGLHFEVEDTGIGIDAKHIPRLTERFYRVDPGRTRQTGGTGLGLAIVKHVLLRHNASLHISSVVGKGSVFRCDFS